MNCKYRFIAAEKHNHPVRKLCRVVRVSPSAYYLYARHDVGCRIQEDADLLKRIQRIFKSVQGRYGAPRVLKRLRGEGIRTSQKRVARLMRYSGLVARPPRRYKRTTIADPGTQLTNLVQRSFAVSHPNELWAADITYVRTWEGWLYVAVVIDCYSRRVVGWAIAEHMRDELVESALRMAIANRKPRPGIIHHSDRGSQYTSATYRAVLERKGFVQSVSRPADCWDNAMVESFFSTLKMELIYRSSWPTRRSAKSAIFEYIEGFYNCQRIHTKLSFKSPAEFEAEGLRLNAA